MHQVIQLIVYSVRDIKIVLSRYSFSFVNNCYICYLIDAIQPIILEKNYYKLVINPSIVILNSRKRITINLVNFARKMGAVCCQEETKNIEVSKAVRKPHIDDHMVATAEK